MGEPIKIKTMGGSWAVFERGLENYKLQMLKREWWYNFKPNSSPVMKKRQIRKENMEERVRNIEIAIKNRIAKAESINDAKKDAKTNRIKIEENSSKNEFIKKDTAKKLTTAKKLKQKRPKVDQKQEKDTKEKEQIKIIDTNKKPGKQNKEDNKKANNVDIDKLVNSNKLDGNKIEKDYKKKEERQESKKTDLQPICSDNLIFQIDKKIESQEKTNKIIPSTKDQPFDKKQAVPSERVPISVDTTSIPPQTGEASPRQHASKDTKKSEELVKSVKKREGKLSQSEDTTAKSEILEANKNLVSQITKDKKLESEKTEIHSILKTGHNTQPKLKEEDHKKSAITQSKTDSSKLVVHEIRKQSNKSMPDISKNDETCDKTVVSKEENNIISSSQNIEIIGETKQDINSSDKSETYKLLIDDKAQTPAANMKKQPSTTMPESVSHINQPVYLETKSEEKLFSQIVNSSKTKKDETFPKTTTDLIGRENKIPVTTTQEISASKKSTIETIDKDLDFQIKSKAKKKVDNTVPILPGLLEKDSSNIHLKQKQQVAEDSKAMPIDDNAGKMAELPKNFDPQIEKTEKSQSPQILHSDVKYMHEKQLDGKLPTSSSVASSIGKEINEEIKPLTDAPIMDTNRSIPLKQDPIIPPKSEIKNKTHMKPEDIKSEVTPIAVKSHKLTINEKRQRRKTKSGEKESSAQIKEASTPHKSITPDMNESKLSTFSKDVMDAPNIPIEKQPQKEGSTCLAEITETNKITVDIPRNIIDMHKPKTSASPPIKEHPKPFKNILHQTEETKPQKNMGPWNKEMKPNVKFAEDLSKLPTESPIHLKGDAKSESLNLTKKETGIFQKTQRNDYGKAVIPHETKQTNETANESLLQDNEILKCQTKTETKEVLIPPMKTQEDLKKVTEMPFEVPKEMHKAPHDTISHLKGSSEMLSKSTTESKDVSKLLQKTPTDTKEETKTPLKITGEAKLDKVSTETSKLGKEVPTLPVSIPQGSKEFPKLSAGTPPRTKELTKLTTKSSPQTKEDLKIVKGTPPVVVEENKIALESSHIPKKQHELPPVKLDQNITTKTTSQVKNEFKIIGETPLSIGGVAKMAVETTHETKQQQEQPAVKLDENVMSKTPHKSKEDSKFPKKPQGLAKGTNKMTAGSSMESNKSNKPMNEAHYHPTKNLSQVKDDTKLPYIVPQAMETQSKDKNLPKVPSKTSIKHPQEKETKKVLGKTKLQSMSKLDQEIHHKSDNAPIYKDKLSESGDQIKSDKLKQEVKPKQNEPSLKSATKQTDFKNKKVEDSNKSTVEDTPIPKTQPKVHQQKSDPKIKLSKQKDQASKQQADKIPKDSQVTAEQTDKKSPKITVKSGQENITSKQLPNTKIQKKEPSNDSGNKKELTHCNKMTTEKVSVKDTADDKASPPKPQSKSKRTRQRSKRESESEKEKETKESKSEEKKINVIKGTYKEVDSADNKVSSPCADTSMHEIHISKLVKDNTAEITGKQVQNINTSTEIHPVETLSTQSKIEKNKSYESGSSIHQPAINPPAISKAQPTQCIQGSSSQIVSTVAADVVQPPTHGLHTEVPLMSNRPITSSVSTSPIFNPTCHGMMPSHPPPQLQPGDQRIQTLSAQAIPPQYQRLPNAPQYQHRQNTPSFKQSHNTPPYQQGTNNPPFQQVPNTPPYQQGTSTSPYQKGRNTPPFQQGRNTPPYPSGPSPMTMPFSRGISPATQSSPGQAHHSYFQPGQSGQQPIMSQRFGQLPTMGRSPQLPQSPAMSSNIPQQTFLTQGDNDDDIEVPILFDDFM